MNELSNKIRKLIADEQGIDQSRIVDDTELQFDLGMNSLDTLELIVLIEQTLGISIGDEDAEKVKTFKELITLIEETEYAKESLKGFPQ
ncbi:MAG: hypothetical protein A6F70_03725 [Cycloclasticus sp. symbiont of Bathymodiolus heckerae]|nr:MAG: hypothetical protein A6F70_03725 [Cycloclasticus sp. symbiont of Bathymodiolus heckerae]